MLLTETTIRAVLVTAIQTHGNSVAVKDLITETVDALIAADQVLRTAINKS